MTHPLPSNGAMQVDPIQHAETWAVIGASGFIGSAVIAELRSQGKVVIPISAPRLTLAIGSTPEDVVRELSAHEEALEGLSDAIAGTDVVVNAAGMASPDSSSLISMLGANSLLPVLVLAAASRAGTRRFIHLSSAAVQGRMAVINEMALVAPFSAYSRSKALGEASLSLFIQAKQCELVVLRATSVQGAGRSTTVSLRRLARSRLASVARPGSDPTVVSSLTGLVKFVTSVGSFPSPVPPIVLQPWEGLTTIDVMTQAGGKRPLRLPRALCQVVIHFGYLVARALPSLQGTVRRVELMWFGQKQEATWARSVGLEGPTYIEEVLRAEPEVRA